MLGGQDEYFVCFDSVLLTGGYAWVFFNKQCVLKIHIFYHEVCFLVYSVFSHWTIQWVLGWHRTRFHRPSVKEQRSSGKFRQCSLFVSMINEVFVSDFTKHHHQSFTCYVEPCVHLLSTGNVCSINTLVKRNVCLTLLALLNINL